MAQTATIYNFDIELADVDRGVYDTLALRVAQHPSESDEFLATRVLAYCLEFTEGITFSPGISTPDEPAVAVRDLTGAWLAWIDVGSPDAARLHKAAKTAPRVVVYPHRAPDQWLKLLAGERLHRADAIEIQVIDRTLIAGLVQKLARRLAFSLTVNDRHLLVALDSGVIEGPVVRVPVPGQ